MPLFEITAPDGGVFEIEGDNEQGALAALKKFQGGPAAPSLPVASNEAEVRAAEEASGMTPKPMSFRPAVRHAA
jgi:hypothetical protein